MSLLQRILTRALDDGHTAIDGPLATHYQRWMKGAWTVAQLEQEEAEGNVLRIRRPEGNLLALPRAAQGEARVARWLASPRAPRGALATALGTPPGALGASQGAAWALAAQHGTVVITGGPGTGKSFLASLIIEQLSKSGKLIRVASPTSAAATALASKLQGYTARLPQTIHQMLGWIPGEDPKRDQSSRIDADVILLDEMSMVDSVMMGYIADAVSNKTHVIFVGDPNQLLPVGAGSPFLDLIRLLPHVELQEIHRQKDTSGIIPFARAVLEGKLDPGHFKLPNIHHFRVPDAKVDETVRELYCSTRLQDRFGVDDPIRSTMVVSALRTARREASTTRINEVISQRLFPDRIDKLHRFAIGDRVMFTVNDRERGFINGEIGWLEAAKFMPPSDPKKLYDFLLTIKSRYGDTLSMTYRAVADKIDHAYATTVHKAQGSESDVVILLAPTSHREFLTMNLIYTAATRAKKELIIVGEADTICRGSRISKPRLTLLPYLTQHPELVAKLLSPPVPEMDFSKVWD